MNASVETIIVGAILLAWIGVGVRRGKMPNLLRRKSSADPTWVDRRESPIRFWVCTLILAGGPAAAVTISLIRLGVSN